MPIQLDLIDFVRQRERTREAHARTRPPSALRTEEAAPQTGGFETDVSRAVYSAAIMRPIYELEARRLRQGDSDDTPAIWDGMDLMWIAFAVLDVISELTEYQTGATRAEVVEKILPLARRQALACGLTPADEGLLEVVNKVFDHLVNRGNRYLPFRYTCFDAAARQHRTRTFWLIKTVYTGEGREALFALTDEGYAAYFGLHETGALDAAAIGNLRIKLLIDRGNVDDAISVADGNRKQCARKALEVRNVRRLIQRNIHAVDFERLHALAEEGVNQATDIQKEGSRLHNMVIENLLRSEGPTQGSRLHRLAEQLESLNHQLMKLSGELQRLPEDYHHHSHKLFRRRSLGAFPTMEEILGRVFGMLENEAARIGTEFIARIDPPAQRPLFDPAAVIEACDRALERQNVPGDRSQPLIEVDGAPVARFLPDLDESMMRRAFEMIRTRVHRGGDTLLSALLSDAAERSASGEAEALFPVAAAMAVFQLTVERRLAEKHRIRVDMTDPDARIRFNLPAGRRYRGHELLLTPRNPSVRPGSAP